MTVTVAHPSATQARFGSLRIPWRAAASFVLVGAIGYLVLVPLARLQLLALKNGGEGYRDAFDRPELGKTILTTIALAVGSLIIAMTGALLLSWAVMRLPRRLRWMRVLPILPLIVPGVATVLGWTFLLSPRPGYLNALLRKLPWWNHLTEGPVDVYSLPWIIIITGFGLTAFVYVFLMASFANLNQELVEAASVCGASSPRVFFHTILPLVRPALVYGGATALLLGLGQFTGPLLLGTNSGVKVLTTEMYYSITQLPVSYAGAAALGTPLLLFGVAMVLFQRRVLRDRGRFVTHGGKSFGVSGRTTWRTAPIVMSFVVAAIILPLIGLTLVALSKYWNPEIHPSKFTLVNFREAFDTPRVTDAIKTSVVSSITAVVIALPLGYVVAHMVLYSPRRRFSAVADFIVALPLGVPAVIFGVGFLYTYTHEPLYLYGTQWIIIIVYITLMLPYAARMSLTALSAVGNSHAEAARMSGAGPLRTHTRTIVPMIRPALGGAAALMFIFLTHEFAASLLVRSVTAQLMGTVLFDYWINGSYPMVATIALIMAAVTGAGVVVAFAAGGRGFLDRL